jgi:hemerythrin-like domain-containing protein
MHDILDGLKRDHANFGMLLKAFERELKLFDTGARPDYELIEDILRYSLDYPDQTHHRTEEYLVRRICREHAGIKDVLRNIEREHDLLREAAEVILAQLDAILMEQPTDREAFARKSRAFIDDYRNHMQREESILFPLVDDLLPACESLRIPLRQADAADPVFGHGPGYAADRLRAVVTTVE